MLQIERSDEKPSALPVISPAVTLMAVTALALFLIIVVVVPLLHQDSAGTETPIYAVHAAWAASLAAFLTSVAGGIFLIVVPVGFVAVIAAAILAANVKRDRCRKAVPLLQEALAALASDVMHIWPPNLAELAPRAAEFIRHAGADADLFLWLARTGVEDAGVEEARSAPHMKVFERRRRRIRRALDLAMTSAAPFALSNALEDAARATADCSAADISAKSNAPIRALSAALGNSPASAESVLDHYLKASGSLLICLLAGWLFIKTSLAGTALAIPVAAILGALLIFAGAQLLMMALDALELARKV